MQGVGEATALEALDRSGDSWELVLIELRREAVAETFSMLDSVWHGDE